MATIAEHISNIRLWVNDPNGGRWTDANITSFLKLAYDDITMSDNIMSLSQLDSTSEVQTTGAGRYDTANLKGAFVNDLDPPQMECLKIHSIRYGTLTSIGTPINPIKAVETAVPYQAGTSMVVQYRSRPAFPATGELYWSASKTQMRLLDKYLQLKTAAMLLATDDHVSAAIDREIGRSEAAIKMAVPQVSVRRVNYPSVVFATPLINIAYSPMTLLSDVVLDGDGNPTGTLHIVLFQAI